EQMRRDIRLQFKGVTAAWTGLNATFAFNLSYRGRDPEMAAQVANALAADYVEESARARQRETAKTTEFLQAQLDEASQKLKDQEQRMSEFTARYGGELPDRQGGNPAADDQRAKIEAELNVLRSNEQAVRREIASYEQRVNGASLRTQELQQLTEDYAAAKTQYQSLLQRLQEAQLAAGLAQQRLQ